MVLIVNRASRGFAEESLRRSPQKALGSTPTKTLGYVKMADDLSGKVGIPIAIAW
jgi:hypothetical protein